MSEPKVTEAVVSVEEVTTGPGGGGMEVEVTTGPGGGGMEVEVTTGPGGGDVEVSRGATVDVSITVAAHANRYRSYNV